MVRIAATFLLFCISAQLLSQTKCGSTEYWQHELDNNQTLSARQLGIENFIRKKESVGNNAQLRVTHLQGVIKIPVVFHVLYHLPGENIPTETINNMLKSLNRDFRRKNADSSNTPVAFKPFAADMEIEFALATMDPQGRSTTGIIKKYTPISQWYSDDNMKYSASYGDDAWDYKSYLNIWICNMKDALGYSTFPGAEQEQDGIVLAVETFRGAGGTTKEVNDYRTLVHEAGHWLNLRHIWGDRFCGDDLVDDTPKQSTYTPGCPSGTRQSCGNSPTGDMYMNYMDFTNDACMNMFTNGQKQRARIIFEPGGPRNSILSSKGLNISQIEGSTLPEFYPKWLEAKIYPNPATSKLNVYFEYDERWVGKEIQIVDMMGRVVIKKIISSVIQEINISNLSPGVYFIRAEKDGERVRSKFVKL